MREKDWIIDETIEKGPHERNMKNGKGPTSLVEATLIYPTPSSNPTHPGCPSKWRLLIEQNAREVSIGMQLTPKSDGSGQYVRTVLVSDRLYCRWYDDGVAKPRLVFEVGCCPEFLVQSSN